MRINRATKKYLLFFAALVLLVVAGLLFFLFHSYTQAKSVVKKQFNE